jgi:hypothetical protein
MTLELVLYVCLAAAPAECRYERVGFLEAASLSSCAMASQPTAAKWAGEHEAYQIREIICRPMMDEA